MNFKLYVLCALSMLLTMYVQAQDLVVHGTVNDDGGLPVAGATVLLKNTSNGTYTDFDGKFELEVPSDGTLVISYIGFVTVEVQVNGQDSITVNLVTDLQSLEEVVVVGYGTQKKSVVTGAIASIKASELEDLPVTRIEQSLQGRTSGLTIVTNSGQPGSSSTIRVRGVTTLGNNEPLWVVDGVIVDNGGIGYLNQSDIASIEVLKDAASAAIYGSRAATGVILITTKKGQSGKLSVNYNGYTGFSGPARKLDLLNATQYATLMNERYASSADPNNFQLPYPNAQSYGKGTDWQDLIFNDSAQRQSHELSLSGGNDTSTFYASFGYLDQDGIVTSAISHYTRKNFRLNSTHKINDYITFGQTFGFSDEKNTGIDSNNYYGGPLASAINLDPITPAIETDPTVINQGDYAQPNIIYAPNGFPYGISSHVGQEMTNPLAYVQTKLGNYNWADNFVGNAYVEVEPIKGLKARSTFAGKMAFWGSRSFNPESFLTSSFVNNRNSLSKSTNRGFGWNIENTISYQKEINGHDFTVLLGQGAYVDNITDGQNVTYYDLPVNSYKDADFGFDISQDNIVAGAYKNDVHKVISLFARLNYAYKDKYLLTAIVRRDGSTNFGANNKFGYFPSFSLGWVPTEEDFWPENDVVNQLKIRGSYGVTGNDQIGAFGYLSTISGGRNYYLGDGTQGSIVIGNSPDAPANPDLKWEETNQTNIGFDARLFKSLTLTFDWYNKKTIDILRYVPLPGYLGSTGSPAVNIGDMKNVGVDVNLGYSKQFDEFGFSLNGNVSTVKNEIIYLGTDTDYISGDGIQASSVNSIIRTQVGHPINSFYGFMTDGIFQNQAEINAYTNTSGGLIQPNAVPGDFRWKDINGDGAITSDDRDFLGSSIPKVTFGFTMNFNYKDFDLLVFAQGASGNKIYQAIRRLDIGTANFQTSALGRWTGEGTSNTFPRLTANDTNNNFSNPSDFYLEDGDYIRFKTIQLGYTLPNDVLNKVGIDKIRVYLTGENLFTFTKYSGFDPEIGGGVFGIDRGYYPQARTGMLGVNLQF